MIRSSRLHTRSLTLAVARIRILAVMGILVGLHLAPMTAEAASVARGASEYFTDIELVDQNGETHRLYSDLLEGKVVVINAMFTSCSNSCPAMAARLAKIQRYLGDRLGKDVHILSISVDPEKDTPERLHAFADTFEARPGWYLLSGKKENVSQALRKLGQYVDEPEAHQSVMIMGNEPTGLWKKAMGLAPAEDLIEVLQSVMEDRE